jgi:hypothetical protein
MALESSRWSRTCLAMMHGNGEALEDRPVATPQGGGRMSILYIVIVVLLILVILAVLRRLL